jgi:hypothetical protein
MNSQFLRIIFYLFPLFLVGIFFMAAQSFAQSHVIDATVNISVCGNNVREAPIEDCDNDDFGGYTCVNYGYDGGTLDCDAACTIITSGCTTDEDDPPDDPPPGGGGGGGGSQPPPATTVNFYGRAYPMSSITILKDGQIAIQTIAGPDANFSASLSGLSAGHYTFSLYGEDINGHRSSLFTFSVYVSQGSTTSVSGIYITPTIRVDKAQVLQGDNIAIFGQTVPDSDVVISVNSEPEHFRYTDADEDGIYLHNFDTSVLTMGSHHTKSKSILDGDTSTYGAMIGFLVGDSNIPLEEDVCGAGTGDVNCDYSVNLIDFSIVAYWYQRSNPPSNTDLNNDGKVDLIDFSIMAYYWTG